MKCSEFVEKFSEFKDADEAAPIRKDGEEHLLGCERCRHYSSVVSMGVCILKEIPSAKLPENFWSSLEHRIFHVRDEKMLSLQLPRAAIPLGATCVAVLLMILISNSHFLNPLRSDVELPAIVVSRSPNEQLRIPRSVPSMFEQRPNSRIVNSFWSDINGLIYEYSSMSERYRTFPVLRQTDLVQYK